jgi:hypothetical protein
MTSEIYDGGLAPNARLPIPSEEQLAWQAHSDAVYAKERAEEAAVLAYCNQVLARNIATKAVASMVLRWRNNQAHSASRLVEDTKRGLIPQQRKPQD